MDYIKKTLYDARVEIVKKMVNPPTESIFLKEGQLTVSEFLESGDKLIQSCPSWRWKSAVNEKTTNSLLPQDRQYLLLERIPCNQRISELQENANINEKDGEDEWIISENVNQKQNLENQLQNMNINEHSEEEKKQTENMHEENVIICEAPQEIRYYDLSIVYDFYHFTPRLFLSGVDENNKPLTHEDIFQDIQSEYANKTVTFEDHPHLGTKQASLHPCRHAQVLKHMIDTIQSNGGIIEPHMAVQIFLKFLSSVIPTIEYDISNDFYL